MAVDLTEKYTSGEWLSSDGSYINPNYVFLQNELNNYFFLALQGGTRSGKTYNVIMYIWYLIHNFNGMKIGIYKESMPTLLDSVYLDFIKVGANLELYDAKKMNKTRYIYSYNGNEVHFRGLDEEGKTKGIKNDIIFLNEANHIKWELVQQLLYRNEGRLILDYNPSDVDSWIYDKILTRDSCALLRTTYKDNVRHLADFQLAEIEYLRINDPDQYLIYGKGERAERKGQIYKNWDKIQDDEFDWRRCDIWAMDFGATVDPTVIMKGHFSSRDLYVKQLLYSQDVRNFEILIYLFINGYNEDRHTLVGDGKGLGAGIITELRSGIEMTRESIVDAYTRLKLPIRYQGEIDDCLKFVRYGTPNILRADQRAGAIMSGIEKLKTFSVKLAQSSAETINETHNYVWKQRGTKTLGEPVDRDNHAMDCIRYMALGYGRQHNY